MERLAKDKIAAQNRILFLKRELATYDIDYTKLLPEATDISAVKLERSGESEKFSSILTFATILPPLEPALDASGKSSLVYSSMSPLSSVTTTSSTAYPSNLTSVSRSR